MENLWKILNAPIVMLILGSLLGFLGARIAAETPNISATVRWAEVDNPFFGLNQPAREKALKLEQEAFPGSNYLWAMNRLRNNFQMRVVSVDIRNNSSLKSKEIEVVSDTGAFTSREAKEGSKDMESRLTLRSLDPGEEVKIYGLVSAWPSYLGQPLQVLHDNRSVPLTIETITFDFLGFGTFLTAYPEFGSLALVTMLLSTVLLAIAVVVGFIGELSKDFRLRIMTKKDVKKLHNFIEWVKHTHPEKLAD
jgi:hypothetical protein